MKTLEKIIGILLVGVFAPLVLFASTSLNKAHIQKTEQEIENEKDSDTGTTKDGIPPNCGC